MAKAQWPDDVPILSADDLTWRGESQDGERKDLLIWFDHAFGLPTAPRLYAEGQEMLKAVLSDRIGKPVTALWHFAEYVESHHKPSLAWQAACWNEMLGRLGYELPAECRKDPGRT